MAAAERAKSLERDRNRKESRTQSACGLASSLNYLNARVTAAGFAPKWSMIDILLESPPPP